LTRKGTILNIYESITSEVKDSETSLNLKKTLELKLIIKLLESKVGKMWGSMLYATLPFFMEMPFFKSLHLKEKETFSIVNTLTLQHFEKQDIVMEIGDKGENFYIIL
jgi:hypothetical protein